MADPNADYRHVPWRSATTPAKRRAGLVATAVYVLVIGLAILILGVLALSLVVDPTIALVALWGVLTVWAIYLVLRPRTPAMLNPVDESQGWVEFTIRAGAVGIDQPRSPAARVVAALVAGSPTVLYLTVAGLISLGSSFTF